MQNAILSIQKSKQTPHFSVGRTQGLFDNYAEMPEWSNGLRLGRSVLSAYLGSNPSPRMNLSGTYIKVYGVSDFWAPQNLQLILLRQESKILARENSINSRVLRKK